MQDGGAPSLPLEMHTPTWSQVPHFMSGTLIFFFFILSLALSLICQHPWIPNDEDVLQTNCKHSFAYKLQGICIRASLVSSHYKPIREYVQAFKLCTLVFLKKKIDKIALIYNHPFILTTHILFLLTYKYQHISLSKYYFFPLY